MRFEVLEALNPLSRSISLETAIRRQPMIYNVSQSCAV